MRARALRSCSTVADNVRFVSIFIFFWFFFLFIYTLRVYNIQCNSWVLQVTFVNPRGDGSLLSLCWWLLVEYHSLNHPTRNNSVGLLSVLFLISVSYRKSFVNSVVFANSAEPSPGPKRHMTYGNNSCYVSVSPWCSICIPYRAVDKSVRIYPKPRCASPTSVSKLNFLDVTFIHFCTI
jgi:hypothetical protein